MEWTLHQEAFDSLRKRWPVMVDLFASSLNHRCGVYFAPSSDPMAAGTDAILQSWDYLEGYTHSLCLRYFLKCCASSGSRSRRSSLCFGRRGSGSRIFWSCSWNLLFFYQRGGILCVSLMSTFTISGCPCFVFIHGDYQAICVSLRIISLSGSKTWRFPEGFLDS